MDQSDVLVCGGAVSQKIEIFTKMRWTSDDGKRSITVSVHPVGDMDIRYECSGAEDQLLELDEPAWHALYEMVGGVKP
jgi:hypothetical protein